MAENISLKEIKIIKEKGCSSILSIDGMKFLVEKNKANCRYETKTYKKSLKFGKHYEFPKKALSFSAYFTWILKSGFSTHCLKHQNCNFSAISHINSIKTLLLKQEKYSQILKKTVICKKVENKIFADLSICNNFPISIKTMLPLFEILAKFNPILLKFADFLKTTPFITNSILPIKTVFPIAFAICAQIQFNKISFQYFENYIKNIENQENYYQDLISMNILIKLISQ